MDRQRIDKWLWHARVVRTRSAAAGLVDGGSVRINGSRADAASRAVRPGDVVTIALDCVVRILRVVDFAERRGAASVAAALFDDLTPPPDEKTETDRQAAVTRRPTKHERRELLRLKRPEED